MRGSPRYAADHSADQRDCALYRIYVLDPRTNYTTVCLGYIGETAREPFVRFLEHLYEQPFGDTIVGFPQVDPRVFAGKDEVLEAERLAVEAERPLYNYEWNLDNPDRIEIWRTRQQRAERDAKRAAQRGETPQPKARSAEKTQPAAKTSRRRPIPKPAPAAVPVVVDSGRPWLFTRPALLGYGWLVLAVVVALLMARMQVVSGWNAAEAGAGTATFLYALAWLTGSVTPRRNSRRRR